MLFAFHIKLYQQKTSEDLANYISKGRFTFSVRIKLYHEKAIKKR